jgi:hypothetical protein
MLPFGIDITTFESNQFLIPFLFVLAIVFGALEQANVFRSRAVNFIVAAAISFFAVSNTAFTNLLWSQFGNVTIFFIAMFFIIFILEAFGVRKRYPGEPPGGALVITGGILFVLLSIGLLIINLLPPIPFIGGGQNLLLLFAIVLILLIFWLAYKIGSGKPSHPQQQR